MTSEQYRKAWDRLYTQSARANSAEECDAIQKKLDKLNADYAATVAERTSRPGHPLARLREITAANVAAGGAIYEERSGL